MAREKSDLSREDVCLIIETGAKAGVTELKFRDLHVKFGTSAGLSEVAPGQQQPPQNQPVNALTEQQHTAQTAEAIKAEELRLRREQLAMLRITNPGAYEKLIQDGELTDDVDDSDDGDDEPAETA